MEVKIELNYTYFSDSKVRSITHRAEFICDSCGMQLDLDKQVFLDLYHSGIFNRNNRISFKVKYNTYWDSEEKFMISRFKIDAKMINCCQCAERLDALVAAYENLGDDLCEDCLYSSNEGCPDCIIDGGLEARFLDVSGDLDDDEEDVDWGNDD